MDEEQVFLVDSFVIIVFSCLDRRVGSALKTPYKHTLIRAGQLIMRDAHSFRAKIKNTIISVPWHIPRMGIIVDGYRFS